MPGHPGPAFGRPERKLVPGIHAFLSSQGVDGRDKRGHDDDGVVADLKRPAYSAALCTLAPA
jgi:hypothetical protein